MIDESNIAWWFWLVLAVEINATWIGMDMWLHRHHHEYLTDEIREILAGGGWWALIAAAVTGATFGIVLFHFFWER